MENVMRDYSSTTLSLKAHPVSFVRPQVEQLGILPAARLKELKNGMPVKVCGLITVRQRPGTAKGVLFVTIEDETGFANLVIWAKTFEKYRKVIVQSRLFMVSGKVQIEGEVIHVVAHSCRNLTPLMNLNADPRDLGSVQPSISKKQVEEILKKGNKGLQGELFPSRDFK